MGSLPCSVGDLEVLSKGLRLLCDAAMVSSLLSHKLGTLSVIDLDLTTNQVGGEIAENDTELKFQFSSVSKYVFASSTPEHMFSAQQRLGCLGVVEFHMYDDSDGVSQGNNTSLSGAKYDLVILRIEVAKVENLELTVKNARRFLAPTSFLVLVVTAPPCNGVQSAATSASTKNTEIITTVLPSTDLGLESCSISHPSTLTGSPSVFVCRPVECTSNPDNRVNFITVDLSRGYSKCMELIQRLKTEGWAGTLVGIQEAGSQPVETPILLLDDPMAPLLATIDEQDWAHLKEIMTAGRKILWLTCGSQFQVSRPLNSIERHFTWL